ncbi:MaoC/PaaZ C-terminal domain-containing protein [Caulobacter endophyticus]|uniref:MaoC/PaaZ C-terminal domain-containing protein n=1 Tax=Caulobacter endophyticus TaxID=2172652 RepID=UPI00241039F6|nr:MaoC/PaaZ C-terminal domain-containing protein [Caulobacter endophyticus]MDG2530945.1 MaoC/PaaZ C-terminal domain-containing protein [Caulobacter endophyticus]
MTDMAEPVSALALAGGVLRGLLRRGGTFPDVTLEAGGVWLRCEAIDAYAQVCGFAPGAGVPLTFPHILAFPLQMRLMLAADFPYPVMGLVHLSNRIVQHAPLKAGDRLAIAVRTGRLLAHDKGQAFSLETTARRDGQAVWEGTSVYLRLGGPGRGDVAPILDGGPADAPVERWTLPADLGRRYAKVSGDANPIHTSALGAKLFGFRRAIAHGMWVKARAVAALTAGRPVQAGEIEVAFRAPVFLPGEIQLLAGPDGAERAFEIKDAQGARTHLRGRLSLKSQDPSC